MKKLILGVLAHVDSGKTTLSEALLYLSGTIRTLGRVDHADAFLDTDAIERERGITVFAKQAVFSLGDTQVTLLDTPGHVDFSAEAERTLQVLDCAVLLISGTDGVQGHTRTLWRLLQRYNVPTLIFVNKMDLAGADREAVLAGLKTHLSPGCVDCEGEHFFEEAALDEGSIEEYFEGSALSDDTLRRLVGERKLFPCFFGAALKLEGVEALMEGLERFAPQVRYGGEFGARVYKISRDSQGNRLTHMKLTGGSLAAKTLLRGGDGSPWGEKADQLRLYSGAKFRPLERAEAGDVIAVTGLTRTRPGDGLGAEGPWTAPVLEPVLTYRILLPEGVDPHTAVPKLRQLEEEDPQLHILWQGESISIQLMGEVQQEILQRMIWERFGMEVSFGEGAILYRETIENTVEGIGHFEPLRHYAEVHLVLEPAPRGSGLTFAAICPEDMLDRNWQRLILTHLYEKDHLGVLTGSPITDVRITLVSGKAHLKHTEGGDFRQATYRAVRQGLMQAKSVLLEPWYEFRMEVPSEALGRAMSDLQRMGGDAQPPETVGEEVILLGSAPVAALRSYARDLAAYTRGRGRLTLLPGGFRPCAEAEKVISEIGYEPERDTENTADSVFCEHGAGVNVKWSEVPAMAHLPLVLRPREAARETAPQTSRRPSSYAGTLAEDKELQAIFERTYGPTKNRSFQPQRPTQAHSDVQRRAVPERKPKKEYLLVDGYNIIFAWEELSRIAQDNMDAARKRLCDQLCNYQGYKKCQVILVFDAYRVKGGQERQEKYHNIHVVYTKEAETADAFIERTTYELGRECNVRVATSDGAEQIIILGHGALRLSATAFYEEMTWVEGQIAAAMERSNRAQGRVETMRSAMEQAKRVKEP